MVAIIKDRFGSADEIKFVCPFCGAQVELDRDPDIGWVTVSECKHFTREVEELEEGVIEVMFEVEDEEEEL